MEVVGYFLYKENGKVYDVLDNLGVVICIRRIDVKVFFLGKYLSREVFIVYIVVFFEFGMLSL